MTTNKDIEAIYPLSRQQLGMLLESVSAPNSGTHIEQKIYSLQGELNVAALKQAWQQLVERHTALRTAFVWQYQAEPLQVVLSSPQLRFENHDWSNIPESAQREKLTAYLEADRREGFKLTKAPLLRLALFDMGESCYRLVWTRHHIVLDGWCGPIIEQEIRSLYDAFSNGRDLQLPPSRPYRDYIVWLMQQDLSKAELFWRQSLRGITRPTPLGVEIDQANPAQNGQPFGSYSASLSATTSDALKSLARQNHLTVNTIIQGVWALLLSRYSRQSDVVFGTTVSGRPAELESVGSMIGLFINTLPFRVRVTDESLVPWLRTLQEQHLEVRDYEYCSAGQIHQWSDVPGALPLYESILVFENYPTNPASVGGVRFDQGQNYSIGAQTRYALNILAAEESKLSLSVSYDRSRLDPEDIVRLVDHIFTLVKAIVADPDQNLKTLANRIPADQTPTIRRPSALDEGRVPGTWLAPRNATEEALALIWAEVLGIDTLSINDNFFALHGHSLLAAQVFSRVLETFKVQLPLRCLFESPTIAGLAERIEIARRGQPMLETARLVPVSRDAELPLSFAQQRLWFLNQLQPESPFYNVSLAIRLTGVLNLEALQKALNLIVARHEVLRTVFVTVDDRPIQVILEAQPVTVPVISLSHLSQEDREREAMTLVSREADRTFDLSRGPLLRATLVRLSEEDQILSFNTHHIVSDGWSMAILFRELSVLYEACLADKPSPLPELRIQYADYAVWQRKWLQGEVLGQQLSYWKRQLAGAPPVLELAPDKSRLPPQTYRGARHRSTLPPALSQALKTLSQREGATLFMTLLAAFELLLAGQTGREDIVVGTDLANRARVETEDLIGFFVNLLPIRTDLSGNPGFTELLNRVKEVVLEAYAHQDVPFEKLVEELRPPRDLSRNPLVQILFVMQNTPARVLKLAGLDHRQVDLEREYSRFDLVLFMSEGPEGLESLWVHNQDLFDEDMIARLSGRYQRLLEAVIREPEARLDTLLRDELDRKAMEKKEHHQAQISRLRGMRRKSVDLSQVRCVKTSFLQPKLTLPMVIEPDTTDVDLVEWAASDRDFIDQNLLKHGALLFRGFAVDAVPEFESFAGAICDDLFGEYGDLPREQQGGKVYGSTPYPADETILFHNESSHMHRWPMKIWFFCLKAAEQGGETPIIDCRKVYQLMDKRIRERFEEKKLMYVRNYTDGLDVSWQTFFHSTDKTAVEDYCRKASIEFEWRQGSHLRTRQVCPAVVKHPQTGELVFFNQIQLHHVSCLEPAVRDSLLSMMREEDLPRNVYYGDGSPIEDSIVEEIRELYQKTAVSFPWREGDILMLNNMLTAHGRNPFVGARKIVVAMGEMTNERDI